MSALLCRLSSVLRLTSGALLPASFILLLTSVGALHADDPQTDPKVQPQPQTPSDEIRIVASPTGGQVQLDLRARLSFSYTDPRTGERVLPVIGRVSGLTQAGQLNAELRGIGPQAGFLGMVVTKSVTVTAAYARAEANFSPINPSVLAPTNVAEGGASGNLYNAGIEYHYRNGSSFEPMVAFNHSYVGVHYDVKRFIAPALSSNTYESYPFINADDGSRNNAYRTGVRIKIPVQNWYVTPYLQYSAARYFINVRTTAGAVSNSTNGIPDNPSALTDAWYLRGVGAALNVDSMSRVAREDKSGGFILHLDYKKAVSLTTNVRRNYSKGAWNVNTIALLFVHPNFGVMANYSYAEPEITLSTSRTWMAGPVVTFTF